MNRSYHLRAFTLIEIGIVLTIISILSAIGFTMISPDKSFARARDAKRLTDITNIANALSQCYLDRGESFAETSTTPCYYYGVNQAGSVALGASPRSISDPASVSTQGANEAGLQLNNVIDLCPLVDYGYMSALPVDPSQPSVTIDDAFCPYAGRYAGQLAQWQNTYDTGYQVSFSGGRITLYASSDVHPDRQISITR